MKSKIQNRNNKRQVTKLEKSKNKPKSRAKTKNNAKNREKNGQKHNTGRQDKNTQAKQSAELTGGDLGVKRTGKQTKRGHENDTTHEDRTSK